MYGANARRDTLLYVSHCVFCHGVPGVDRGGNVPNLGYSPTAAIENLDKFVFRGPLTEGGMPDFTGKLKSEEVDKIKAFIPGHGRRDTAQVARPRPWPWPGYCVMPKTCSTA